MLSDEWSYFERQYRQGKASLRCYPNCQGSVNVNDNDKGHRNSGEGQCVVDHQELHPQLGLILIRSTVGVVLVVLVLVGENNNKNSSNQNNNKTHGQKSRWWWEIVTNSIDGNSYNEKGRIILITPTQQQLLAKLNYYQSYYQHGDIHVASLYR